MIFLHTFYQLCGGENVCFFSVRRRALACGDLQKIITFVFDVGSKKSTLDGHTRLSTFVCSTRVLFLLSVGLLEKHPRTEGKAVF